MAEGWWGDRSRGGQGLTRACPQVVPRQPDQSSGRAHADACPPGRGLPGEKTERTQLLRHLLPVRGVAWGALGGVGPCLDLGFPDPT